MMLFTNGVLIRLYKLESDQAAVAKHLAGLNSTLDVYDGILAKQKYLAGDVSTHQRTICRVDADTHYTWQRVTLADFFHLPLGTLLTDMAKLDVLTTDKRPNVSRYVQVAARYEGMC